MHQLTLTSLGIIADLSSCVSGCRDVRISGYPVIRSRSLIVQISIKIGLNLISWSRRSKRATSMMKFPIKVEFDSINLSEIDHSKLIHFDFIGIHWIIKFDVIIGEKRRSKRTTSTMNNCNKKFIFTHFQAKI